MSSDSQTEPRAIRHPLATRSRLIPPATTRSCSGSPTRLATRICGLSRCDIQLVGKNSLLSLGTSAAGFWPRNYKDGCVSKPHGRHQLDHFPSQS